jgi:hypothetical protein
VASPGSPEPVLEARLGIFKVVALSVAAATAFVGFLPGDRTVLDGHVLAQDQAGGVGLVIGLPVMLAPVIVLSPTRRHAGWWIAWPLVSAVIGGFLVCVALLDVARDVARDLPRDLLGDHAPTPHHEALWPQAAIVYGCGALLALFAIVLPVILWLTRPPQPPELPQARVV